MSFPVLGAIYPGAASVFDAKELVFWLQDSDRNYASRASDRNYASRASDRSSATPSRARSPIGNIDEGTVEEEGDDW